MVAGKAFKIAEFWTWVWDMEEYLLQGRIEPTEEEAIEEDEFQGTYQDGLEIPF